MWLGWGGRGGWCGIHFELGKLQPVFLSLVRDVRITRVGCSQCFFMFFLRSSKQLTVGVQTPLHVAEMIWRPISASHLGVNFVSPCHLFGFLFGIFSSACLIFILTFAPVWVVACGFFGDFQFPLWLCILCICLPVGGVRVCVVVVSCFCSPFSIILKVLSGCGGCAGGGSDGGGVKAFLTFVVTIGSLLVSLRLLACFGQRPKSLVLIHCFPHWPFLGSVWLLTRRFAVICPENWCSRQVVCLLLAS